MLIAKYLIISMAYGFIMVGLKDAFPPIKKRLNIISQTYKASITNFLLSIKHKETRDGDRSQQRRASCWTNAPLTSPTKI